MTLPTRRSESETPATARAPAAAGADGVRAGHRRPAAPACPGMLRRVRRTAGAIRTAYLLVGAVAVLAVAALAVPSLLPGDEDVPPVVAAGPGEGAVPEPVAPESETEGPVAAAEPADLQPERPSAPAGAAAPEAPVPTAEGDLAIELVFRQPAAVTGARIHATIRFRNLSLRPMHLPAAGEAHPTLAIVVLDAAGTEVRRVVESASDPWPRRMFELKPGSAMDLPVLVAGGDDAPLPPGEYTVAAEFRRDPIWDRVGLPVWTAPRGSIRTGQEPMTILAAEPR